MDKYDPIQPPDPEVWLALDEGDRMALIAAFHQTDRLGPRLEPAGANMHTVLHAIVENQAAMGDETPVRLKLRQLVAQGLDRHDAIHCIASVLAEQLSNVVKRPHSKRATGGEEAYFPAVRRLNARNWLRSARR